MKNKLETNSNKETIIGINGGGFQRSDKDLGLIADCSYEIKQGHVVMTSCWSINCIRW